MTETYVVDGLSKCNEFDIASRARVRFIAAPLRRLTQHLESILVDSRIRIESIRIGDEKRRSGDIGESKHQ
jgi:hypothetical protein